MNRRLAILYYWLTRKNHVGIRDMAKFLVKPRVPKIASRYITGREEEGDYHLVRLRGIADPLAWPKSLDLFLLYAMIAELLDESSWHYYFHPRTEAAAGDVVVDAGAAEGLFSLLALQRGAKVVAVEPNPVFFASLQKTFQRHIPSRVTIYPYAAGDRDAMVTMSSAGLCSEVNTRQAGNIRMLPLDHLLSDLDRVSFIKADIEGSEMEMLHGASGLIRRFRPKMAITCYHSSNDHKEIANFVLGLVPEYRFLLKGITQFNGRPVMIHFWIPDQPRSRDRE